MKRIFQPLWMLSAAAALLTISCKPSAAPEKAEAAGFKSIKDGSFAESDFSEWLSKANLQTVYEKRAPGTYFAFVEGRNNGGLQEYRHVTRPFTGDKYSEFAVFWGLSGDEFYQVDLKMLRGGFIRGNTQVFVDGTGKAFHQVVWLKPKA